MSKVKIGWTYVHNVGSSVFFAPESLAAFRKKDNQKAQVATCPAVKVFEQRVFIVRSPYTFKIRAERIDGGWAFRPVFPFTEIDEKVLHNVLQFQPISFWRSASAPIAQLMLPYVFFADEIVFINQIEATQVRQSKNWSVIQGRFNIYDWHRPLNWAIEWSDPSKDLVVRRGQPLFQILFELADPSNTIQLVKKDMSDGLRSSIDAAKGVNKLVHGTFGILKAHGNSREKGLLDEEN